uniref:LysM domain-containing protein n=1 Tax=Polytomella parva TaxID=51329 RepID=A0A7S0UNS3_9CHLO|mmetsp:Transcript_12580/g.22487  ORF Transcript_12580/g.22487 Transcript_12580/m.22487 type:complete len:218 (+) Transcript_12580:158-811(+)|eukprot:CAMPEP_0175051504 /NCGR_PEP_ID=MMETSP0052_2-20121109/7843_1 /TAXON_ID=51329 ORGANISM="Polytomella parva, Strain SAG 63-3" /NCGR_SAMPLE_ID=MMETSP0052_2 /ASSEMBLY_ACC=CAM_ASM_000194 /LENGTH=217 /DNA_ID=CAMNT_0016315809 /DNA_START=90 /DNA_END=743 /DNA_ORIENTATION=+
MLNLKPLANSFSTKRNTSAKSLVTKTKNGLRLSTICHYAFNVSMRPYTLRKGDTVESIAKKRGLTVDQIRSLNHSLVSSTEKISEGHTILLPASRLSVRDKEILEGMGTTYRIYPIRGDETISEVMSKRGINRAEIVALNPGVDLDNIKENQLIKLPVNKFTVREREMLIGSGILPSEFFAAANNPLVLGAGLLMLVCGFVMAWQRFYNDPDMVAND